MVNDALSYEYKCRVYTLAQHPKHTVIDTLKPKIKAAHRCERVVGRKGVV